MKCLHVINSLGAGGAERLLADLLPRLHARGVECEILVLNRDGDSFSGVLEAGGVRVLFARPGPASPYSPLRLWDLLKTLRQGSYDLVHAHLAPSFHWVALASLLYPRTRFFATEHATVNRRMRTPWFKAIEAFCYRRFERIVCVSEATALAIGAWVGLGKTRLPVVGNGIVLERFSGTAVPAGDIAAWLGGRKGVVMVARLVAIKDHPTALRALARLPEEYALVLAGDGPELESLKAYAADLGVGGRCLFAGRRQDIPEVLAASVVYLMSSLNEGFGIAAVEAMSVGLPVVAARSPGLASVVDGAGLLFEPGDAEACASLLGKAGGDPELAKDLGARGRARAQAYSIEACAGAYEGLYRAIKGRGPRP